MRAVEHRNFLEALSDFLSLAGLSTVQPEKPKEVKRRRLTVYDELLRPGAIIRTDNIEWGMESVATSMATLSVSSIPWTMGNIDVPADGAMALLDGEKRLHSWNDAPAIVYPDGTGKFYWHGVHVPEYVVKEPKLITAKAIDEEHNQEIRRVMMERFGGVQRYIQECGAKLVHKDECGELYEKKKAPDTFGPLRFVKVKNSTAEPDGTFRDYFIRVPPETETAKAGVAWTFRLTEKEYEPMVQT